MRRDRRPLTRTLRRGLPRTICPGPHSGQCGSAYRLPWQASPRWHRGILSSVPCRCRDDRRVLADGSATASWIGGQVGGDGRRAYAAGGRAIRRSPSLVQAGQYHRLALTRRQPAGRRRSGAVAAYSSYEGASVTAAVHRIPRRASSALDGIVVSRPTTCVDALERTSARCRVAHGSAPDANRTGPVNPASRRRRAHPRKVLDHPAPNPPRWIE